MSSYFITGRSSRSQIVQWSNSTPPTLSRSSLLVLNMIGEAGAGLSDGSARVQFTNRTLAPVVGLEPTVIAALPVSSKRQLTNSTRPLTGPALPQLVITLTDRALVPRVMQSSTRIDIGADVPSRGRA